MSRSRRKTPIFNIGSRKAGRMTWWKRIASKKVRRKVRYWLRKDPDKIPQEKEVEDHWGSPADGKRYREPTPENMRK